MVKVLRSIEKQNGALTPELVVASAEETDSPIHKYFTWDDTEAARKCREEEARKLIQSVNVVFLDNKGHSQTCRAFVNVKPDQSETEDAIGSQGYISIERAAKSGSYQLQVVEYAKAQLFNWRKRFGAFDQFFEVCHAIDKLAA